MPFCPVGSEGVRSPMRREGRGHRQPHEARRAAKVLPTQPYEARQTIELVDPRGAGRRQTREARLAARALAALRGAKGEGVDSPTRRDEQRRGYQGSPTKCGKRWRW